METRMTTKRITACLAFIGIGLSSFMMQAAQAKDNTILEISGAISSCETINSAGECSVRFTFEELRALGTSVVATVTPYTDGVPVFEGVLLRDLLAYVGAEDGALEMIALNDYRATIPARDAHDHGVLLAMKRDGEPMSVRDRGPIWVIYPSGSGSPLDVLAHDHKMVWQLSEILVLK